MLPRGNALQSVLTALVKFAFLQADEEHQLSRQGQWQWIMAEIDALTAHRNRADDQSQRGATRRSQATRASMAFQAVNGHQPTGEVS